MRTHRKRNVSSSLVESVALHFENWNSVGIVKTTTTSGRACGAVRCEMRTSSSGPGTHPGYYPEEERINKLLHANLDAFMCRKLQVNICCLCFFSGIKAVTGLEVGRICILGFLGPTRHTTQSVRSFVCSVGNVWNELGWIWACQVRSKA